jgi:hypothetical protein
MHHVPVGVTQVTVTVRNPSYSTRSSEGLLLVDSGAVDCIMPAKHLKAIGLRPVRKRTYGLADGGEVAPDIGVSMDVTLIFGSHDVESGRASRPWNAAESKSIHRSSGTDCCLLCA